MTFFFGDSTLATFEGNFLEVLRDAMAFAAVIAEADQAIVTVDARKAALVVAAEADTKRLDEIMRAVLGAITTADKGKVTSMPARLAAELAGITTERRQIAGETVRGDLADDLRAVDESATTARARYAVALDAYLRLTEPPGCEREIKLTLVRDNKTHAEQYSTDVTGRSSILGLAWSLELAIPAGSPWADALRVESLARGLSVNAPLKTGLIVTEVKRKRQKIQRWVVTELVDEGSRVRVSVRPEIGKDTGFDFTGDSATGTLTAERTGPKDDPSAGVFAVDKEDVAPLVAFVKKVRDAARALPRKRVVRATLDGTEFDGKDVGAQPLLLQIVSRLVEALAPTTKEIASRSLADDELILRYAHSDGDGEEIFLPKATLRDKIASLDDAHRGLFAPLELSPRPPSMRPPANAMIPDTLRSEPAIELPPMRPKIRSQLAPATMPPPPPPDVRNAARNVVRVTPARRPQSVRPPVATEPLILKTRTKKRASTMPPPPRNQDLFATLKELRAMAKDERSAESFRQLGILFGTVAFGACRAEDRRRALRLLVFSKLQASTEEERTRAHHAALPALQLLVVEHHDPADYEMLGMAYVALGDTEKALDVFKKALAIERKRNAQSPLGDNLQKRVRALAAATLI